MPRPDAHSYVRWSTPAQSEGASLDRQLGMARAYAQAHGLTLNEKLVDPGVSSYRGQHRLKGALAGFLAAIENGTIPPGSYLLVEDQDRLSREEVTDALSLFLQIVNAGVIVVTLSDGRAHSRDSLNGNMGDLFLSVSKMYQAHADSKRKGERVAHAHDKSKAEARAAGRSWHKAGPHWLTWDDKTQRHVTLSERVAVVERVFIMLDDGLGTTAVARRLNDEGVPSPRGKQWHHSAILELAHNRAVLGFYQPKKVKKNQRGSRRPADGEEWLAYPPIINAELFYRVQVKIKGRSFAEGRKQNALTFNNLFQGFSRCAECGGTVGYHGGPRMRSKLRCVDGDRRANGCTNRLRYDYIEVERAILLNVRELDVTPPQVASDAEQRLAKMVAEQGALKIKMDRLLTLCEEGDDLATARYRSHASDLRGLDSKIEAARLEARADSASVPAGERQKQITALLDELDGRTGVGLYDLRARVSSLLSSVVEEVTFYPSGLRELPTWAGVHLDFRGQYSLTIRGGHRMYWFNGDRLSGSLDVSPEMAARRPVFHTANGRRLALAMPTDPKLIALGAAEIIDVVPPAFA